MLVRVGLIVGQWRFDEKDSSSSKRVPPPQHKVTRKAWT